MPDLRMLKEHRIERIQEGGEVIREGDIGVRRRV
jgi:hypothetical protein